jgi:hypothetical protein
MHCCTANKWIVFQLTKTVRCGGDGDKSLWAYTALRRGQLLPFSHVSCLPAAALNERPARGRAFISACHSFFLIYLRRDKQYKKYQAMCFIATCCLPKFYSKTCLCYTPNRKTLFHIIENSAFQPLEKTTFQQSENSTFRYLKNSPFHISEKLPSELQKKVLDICIDSLGLEKLPTINTLKSEYAALAVEKKKLYAEYHPVRKTMQDILSARQNVRQLLNYRDTAIEKETERV